jgi:hypothetical protein
MKTAADYQRQYAIENALVSLIFGDPPTQELAPLAEAIKGSDWQTIADAACALGNKDRNRQFFEDDQLIFIAHSPNLYGVKSLTKADVLFIMQTIKPGWAPPKDMRKRWKKLGLDHLKQGRGNAPELNKWERDFNERSQNSNQVGPPPLYLRS